MRNPASLIRTLLLLCLVALCAACASQAERREFVQAQLDHARELRQAEEARHSAEQARLDRVAANRAAGLQACAQMPAELAGQCLDTVDRGALTDTLGAVALGKGAGAGAPAAPPLVMPASRGEEARAWVGALAPLAGMAVNAWQSDRAGRRAADLQVDLAEISSRERTATLGTLAGMAETGYVALADTASAGTQALAQVAEARERTATEQAHSAALENAERERTAQIQARERERTAREAPPTYASGRDLTIAGGGVDQSRTGRDRVQGDGNEVGTSTDCSSLAEAAPANSQATGQPVATSGTTGSPTATTQPVSSATTGPATATTTCRPIGG